MYSRILVSSLLLLVLLRNLSTAGAIREGRKGGDAPSLAEAPAMSAIHFPEPEDSFSLANPFGAAARNLTKSRRQDLDSTSNRVPGSPAMPAATAAPEVRPLLDEDRLVQLDAAKRKLENSDKKPIEGSVSSTAAPADVNLSQLAEILKDLLNATEDQAQATTTRPVTTASVPKPPSATADADNEFDKFLPHLQEALVKALQKEASEKQRPPTTTTTTTTTRRPPESPPPDSAEEAFKVILPALEDQIGSILEKSKDDQSTAAPLPTQPPAQSVTGDPDHHFSEFLPLLEDALKDTIAKGEEGIAQQHNKPPTPSTTSSPSLTTNSSNDFDDFLPELQRVFSGILQSAQLDRDNELGRKPTRPGTTQKPLSPPSSREPSDTSTAPSSDPLEGSEQLLHALESSLADILNDENSQVQVPLPKPVDTQQNLNVPQPKIVYVLEKYYPQLKKVLEEIVREEEELSSRPPPEHSRALDGVEHRATVQALYKTVQSIFSGHNDSTAGRLNTATGQAAT